MDDWGKVFFPPPIEAIAAAMSGRGATSSTPGSTSMNPPARREAMGELRSGDYYVVAVDDMEQDDSRDPTVLDRLRSSAVRVTVPEGATQTFLCGESISPRQCRNDSARG